MTRAEVGAASPSPSTALSPTSSAGRSRSRPPRWKTYLRLGRVSNLPTIWTNVAAGTLLAGAAPRVAALAGLLAACSLAYIGGMFLNDAFDRRVDAAERPERPIPSGDIAAAEVFAVGAGLLLAALLGITWVASAGAPHRDGAVLAAVALVAAILLYDVWHKGNPASPLVMGSCRALVYIAAGLAAGGEPTAQLWLGAASVGGYVVGLTFVARREASAGWVGYWPVPLLVLPAVTAAASGTTVGLVACAALLVWLQVSVGPRRGGRRVAVPTAVGRLIAGISVVDAALVVGLASAGAAQDLSRLVLVALPGLALTLAGQRFISGT